MTKCRACSPVAAEKNMQHLYLFVNTLRRNKHIFFKEPICNYKSKSITTSGDQGIINTARSSSFHCHIAFVIGFVNATTSLKTVMHVLLSC